MHAVLSEHQPIDKIIEVPTYAHIPYEGYPLMLVEVITLGQFILSTNSAGSQEALLGGKYGMLVPTHDALA